MDKKFSEVNLDSIKQAIANSITFTGVFNQLGVYPYTANYIKIREIIAIHNLDISHFTLRTGQRTVNNKKTLEEWLCRTEKPLSSLTNLKKVILKNNLKEQKCEGKCHIGDRHKYGDYDMPVELHHLDGDRRNNLLDNLEFLCPTCHALTDTWKGRASKKPPKFCAKCGVEVYRTSTYCRKCSVSVIKREIHKSKIEWPSNGELLYMLSKESCVKVAASLGVTDNAIRKRLQKHGLKMPK